MWTSRNSFPVALQRGGFCWSIARHFAGKSGGGIATIMWANDGVRKDRWAFHGLVGSHRSCHRAFSIVCVALIPLFVNPLNTSAATLASDGSRDDVLAKVNAAAIGDTVTIPSGTFEWTSGVIVTQAITLQGLGTVTTDVLGKATVCGTKIQCSVAGAVLTVNLVADRTTRITAIEFIKGSTYSSQESAVVVYGLNTDNRRLRMDHCVWNQLDHWAGTFDTVLGVIDHFTVSAKNGGLFIIDGASWDGTQGVSTYGNGSWAEGENYGTDQFLFFEDGTFAGEFCRSSSTVTVAASGTVTFTVPAGLESSAGVPLAAGYPITATSWDTATGKPDHNFYMAGTVSSYSGTTLVMAPTSADGAGTAKSYWTLSYFNTGFDGQFGGRAVLRNNVFFNASWQNHGLEASHTRGGRVIEFYTNWMVGNKTANNVLFFRSGTGLVHNNHITNQQTASPTFSLLNYSSAQDMCVPFGGPDGRNPWHSNTAAAIVTGTISSATPASYTARDNTKTWTLNQYQNYTIRATSGISVSSMTRSVSTVTVDTAAPHGLVTGDAVSIMGADQAWYNKLYGSCTVTDSDTFTVAIETTPATPATGTIICRKNGFYGTITSSATDGTMIWREGNFGAAYTLQLQVGDTYEINLVYSVMDQCGMGAGSLLTLPIPQTPPAGWPDQVLSPLYEWNNGPTHFDARLDFTGANFYTIVPGRNFTNAVYNYTTYTYPHPLVSESGGGSSGTPAKTGQGRTKNKGPRGRFFQP